MLAGCSSTGMPVAAAVTVQPAARGAAAATEAVVAAQGRLRDPGPTAALAALDDASAALTDILGATYSDAREPLGQALRRDDALLAEHAVALALGDAAADAGVRGSLEQAEGELARVVRQVVGALVAG